MALVMAIDSRIGGELGRASSPASHSGQAVGGLTRHQLGEPGDTTCRCVARGERQHGALERGDAPCDRRSHQDMQSLQNVCKLNGICVGVVRLVHIVSL